MILVRRVLFGLAVAALPMFAGCSSSSTSTSPTPTPVPAQSNVYYSADYNNTIGNAQIGIVGYPITGTSTLQTNILTTATNGLAFTQNLAFDSTGRLFVVNNFAPRTVGVFTPPLTVTSNPTITLTLPATMACAFGIAFDASGNLWAGDSCNDKILEFNGPFTTSATLVANITMVSPADPNGIAFDPTGNLWTALDTTTLSIAEFVKGTGFTNATVATVFLDGLTDADSIAFDKNGNLYAGGDPPRSAKALARLALEHHGMHNMLAARPSAKPNVVEGDGIGFWPPANQINNGLPTVVNNTGLLAGFFSEQMTFDNLGNLYDADCGNSGAIYVFPTATSAWSATLAPVVYTDINDCAEGIAIH
jgi:hypothetical protein